MKGIAFVSFVLVLGVWGDCLKRVWWSFRGFLFWDFLIFFFQTNFMNSLTLGASEYCLSFVWVLFSTSGCVGRMFWMFWLVVMFNSGCMVEFCETDLEFFCWFLCVGEYLVFGFWNLFWKSVFVPWLCEERILSFVFRVVVFSVRFLLFLLCIFVLGLKFLKENIYFYLKLFLFSIFLFFGNKLFVLNILNCFPDVFIFILFIWKWNFVEFKSISTISFCFF